VDQESREPDATTPDQPGSAGTVPPDVPAARQPEAAGAELAEASAAVVPAARTPDTEPDTERVTEPGAEPGAPDEREELERLRAEVSDLRGRTATGPEPARHARGRWRAPVSAVLITVGCVLAR